MTDGPNPTPRRGSVPSTGPAARPAQPSGPWAQTKPPLRPVIRRGGSRLATIVACVIILGSFGLRMGKDLSRPEAWAYWRDLYFAPSLKAEIVEGAGPSRRALAISGEIGAAAAGWFRNEIESARLAPGDTVLFSSPGGQVDQAMIMGETIREHGLTTAVATLDAAHHLTPSYCASACVMAFAGGTKRLDVPGSKLGVHRFTSTGGSQDAVADTQRTTGLLLGYMTRMGVDASIVEAMSATDRIHWLSAGEARKMKLVTGAL